MTDYGETRVASKEVDARLRKGRFRPSDSTIMIPDEPFFIEALRIERRNIDFVTGTLRSGGAPANQRRGMESEPGASQ
jgi:hypothetical protein